MRTFRTFSLAAGVAASLTLPAAVPAAAAPAGPAVGVKVVVQHGPYGAVLAVGGTGRRAGQSLYYATIDPAVSRHMHGGYRPGCTTRFYTKPTALGSPIACTGTSLAKDIDWPALTSSAPPVAGRGVRRALLGRVWVQDLGTWQVTYAGHPLYIFNAPAALGANILESAPAPTALVPPWHTQWRLLAPAGHPATGPASLAAEPPIPGQTHYTTPALGAAAGQQVGQGIATVYAFTQDRPGHSNCTGVCARLFIPLLTWGRPVTGPGLTGRVGVTRRPDGTWQVTYRGHPLYLYSHEHFLQNFFAGTPSTSSAGNGNGIAAFGGTFRAVAP